MISVTQRMGRAVETQASTYLTSQFGFKLVTANYSCKVGEIDLIMQDGDTLVFVEVRYRAQDDYGSALESIDRRKQCKVIRAAKYYLLENNLWEKVPCRFDALVVQATPEKENIEWIRDAFWVK